MKRFVLAPALLLALVGAARADVLPPPEPSLADVQKIIAGTWQSTDDPKFSREFEADGNAADCYQGDKGANRNGTWLLFAGDNPPVQFAGKRVFISDAVYLALTEGGDTQLFAIDGADSQSLEMIYLDRGNTLTFKRIR